MENNHTLLLADDSFDDSETGDFSDTQELSESLSFEAFSQISQECENANTMHAALTHHWETHVQVEQDTITQVIARINELPEQVAVIASNKSLRLSSNDFAKILKLIPGFPENELHKLDKLKAVVLDGNKLHLEGAAIIRVPSPLDASMTLPLKLENLSADLKVEPGDNKTISLENIQGMRLSLPGMDVHIEQIKITQKVEAGRQIVTLEISKHRAVALPGPFHEYMHKQAKALNAQRLSAFSIPQNSEIDQELINKIVNGARQWASADDGRKDLQRMASDLISGITGDACARMVPGVRMLEKHGDKLTLQFKDQPVNILAGVPIVADQTVTARISSRNNKLVFSDITGAKLILPPELSKITGRANTTFTIEEITLGEPDKDGCRIASVQLNGFIESVKVNIKIGPDMRPVEVDKTGNICLRLEMRAGSKLSTDVYFNPEGVRGKTAALYRQLLNREPDHPGCMWAVQKLESGASVKQVVKELTQNAANEFKRSLPTNEAEVVPYLYNRILGRPCVGNEDKGWTEILRQKGVDAVIDGILDSEEFRTKYPDYFAKVNVVDGGKDIATFVEKIIGQSTHPAAADILNGAQSLTIQADGAVVFNCEKARMIANLPLEVAGRVSFKVSEGPLKDELLISAATGVKAKLPLPEGVLAKIGCPKDLPLSAVKVTPVGKEGHRIIQVLFDHPNIKYVQIRVDAQGHPVVENARIQARFGLAIDGKNVGCHLDIASEQRDGALTHVHLDGPASAKVTLLKRLGAPPEIAEVAGDVKAISMSSDTLAIHFNEEITTTISGLRMKLDKTIAVKMFPLRQQLIGDPAVMHEYREFAVHGMQVTGFDFHGNEWKEVGSRMLNSVLNMQKDLPIRIDGLYFASAPNVQQVRVGVFASGALQSAHFTLQNKDNPTFLDGIVQIKNPLRGIGVVPANDDQIVNVRLRQQGIEQPAATARDALVPLLNDPILGLLPPVRIVRNGLALAEFLEEEGLLPW